MRREIRVSGFGGQGVGLAGYILGKALTLYDGKEAVMTQSYGPEARGGASSANVVVSNEPIAYPFVQRPDVLVALSQEAFDKFRDTVRDSALILVDSQLVRTDGDAAIRGIPCTELAEQLGRRIVANMVMMGFFTLETGLVSRTAMIEAIKTSLKPKIIPLNLHAFDEGFNYSREREVIR